jgi:membrane-associated protein
MDDATTQLRRITPDGQPHQHPQQPPHGNQNGYDDQQYYGQYPQAPGYGQQQSYGNQQQPYGNPQQQPYGTQQGGGQPPYNGGY